MLSVFNNNNSKELKEIQIKIEFQKALGLDYCEIKPNKREEISKLDVINDFFIEKSDKSILISELSPKNYKNSALQNEESLSSTFQLNSKIKSEKSPKNFESNEYKISKLPNQYLSGYFFKEIDQVDFSPNKSCLLLSVPLSYTNEKLNQLFESRKLPKPYHIIRNQNENLYIVRLLFTDEYPINTLITDGLRIIINGSQYKSLFAIKCLKRFDWRSELIKHQIIFKISHLNSNSTIFFNKLKEEIENTYGEISEINYVKGLIWNITFCKQETINICKDKNLLNFEGIFCEFEKSFNYCPLSGNFIFNFENKINFSNENQNIQLIDTLHIYFDDLNNNPILKNIFLEKIKNSQENKDSCERDMNFEEEINKIIDKKKEKFEESSHKNEITKKIHRNRKNINLNLFYNKKTRNGTKKSQLIIIDEEENIESPKIKKQFSNKKLDNKIKPFFFDGFGENAKDFYVELDNFDSF